MSISSFIINHLYLDMDGLIFETSVWLLAGSTRLLFLTHLSPKSEASNSKFITLKRVSLNSEIEWFVNFESKAVEQYLNLRESRW